MRIYRTYYNRSSDFPFVASFDEGNIDTEKLVKDIHIGPDCYAHSRFNPDADNKCSPRFWFNVHCERVDIIDDEAYFS